MTIIAELHRCIRNAEKVLKARITTKSRIQKAKHAICSAKEQIAKLNEQKRASWFVCSECEAVTPPPQYKLFGGLYCANCFHIRASAHLDSTLPEFVEECARRGYPV